MKKRMSLLTLIAVCSLASNTYPGGKEKVELDGYAEWREWSLDGQPDLFVVDGQLVRPSAATKFKGSGEALSFETIPLGYEVKVKGVRLADGTVLAREIRAKPNGSAFYEGELSEDFDRLERQFLHEERVVFSDKNYGRLLQGGEPVNRVREIAARLYPPYVEPSEFRVYVVENSEWNAMAAPNGSVYVFNGLLDNMDDDEVAIVLAHELAHVTHEHSRRQFKRNLILSMFSAGAMFGASKIASDGGRLAAEGATIAGTLAWTNGYGRSQEDQADRVGLRYVYEAGYDVRKGPGLWERFAEKYRGLPKFANFFFGNHSVASDRARNLERELRLNYRDPNGPLE